MTEGPHFHFSLSCIGEGNGNPLQCSCLENPRGCGAWWAAVFGVAQSRTRLKRLSNSSSRDDPNQDWPQIPVVKLAKVDLKPCNHPYFMLLFLFPVKCTTPTFKYIFFFLISESFSRKEIWNIYLVKETHQYCVLLILATCILILSLNEDSKGWREPLKPWNTVISQSSSAVQEGKRMEDSRLKEGKNKM